MLDGAPARATNPTGGIPDSGDPDRPGEAMEESSEAAGAFGPFGPAVGEA